MAIILNRVRMNFIGILEARHAQKIAAMRGTGMNSGAIVIGALIDRPSNILAPAKKLEIRRLPDGGLTGLVSPEREAELKAHFARIAEARKNGTLPEDSQLVKDVLQELRDISKRLSEKE